MDLAWLYWDPPKNVFTVPLIDRPIAWYGILFVLGFIFGYFIIVSLFSHFLQENEKSKTDTRQTAYRLTDYLCWFVVLGALIGARLGLVFFYDWPYFRNHPLDIFKVWEGGLASHGGTIGILVGIFFFIQFIKKKVPSLTFLRVVDFVALPTALAACFIRIGNFINQEIVGIPSTLPWAVVFGHPLDGNLPLPRHPVQLYEAACYLLIFIFLFTLWKKKGLTLSPGTLSGLLLILVFTCRFILEFWKSNQTSFIHLSTLQIGQLLSLPFIALGFILIWFGKRKKSLIY